MEGSDPAEKDKERVREIRDINVGIINERNGRNGIKTVTFLMYCPRNVLTEQLYRVRLCNECV